MRLAIDPPGRPQPNRLAIAAGRPDWGGPDQDGFKRTLERLVETSPIEPPLLITPDDPTRGAALADEDLQLWWLRHLLTNPLSLGERMTYFWHGHYTSDPD